MQHSIKPEEHELREVRKVVEGALEACKAFRRKEEDLEIDIKWDSGIPEELEGVTGKTFSFERFEIQFNSDWRKDSLEGVVAHEYAHTLFYEAIGNKSWEDISFMWQVVLMDAHSQHFVEEVFPNSRQPMKDSAGQDELEELWPKIKEALKQEVDWYSELMFGGEKFPKWTGYSAAYMIGKKLLEDHSLEELPELKRSDVIGAGEELFG